MSVEVAVVVMVVQMMKQIICYHAVNEPNNALNLPMSNFQ